MKSDAALLNASLLAGCVDSSALATLLDDLAGDINIVRQFVRDFVRLWECRAKLLTEAIAEQVLETVHVVLLSIRSSSRMVGAPLLETSALLMLNSVKIADLDALGRQVVQLIELGRQTCVALSALLESGTSLAPVTSRAVATL